MDLKAIRLYAACVERGLIRKHFRHETSVALERRRTELSREITRLENETGLRSRNIRDIVEGA